LLTTETPGDAALDAAAARVADALGSDLLGDPYASADYRRHLATVMARRALAKAATRAMAGETVPA
jgi:CO/xanthine dehydrogenase FAD-binding subunit